MTISRIHPRILAAFAAIYILWGRPILQSRSLYLQFRRSSRSLVGGLILFLYARRQGAPTPPRSWLIAGMCGLLFFVGCHGVLAFAQQRVPSGVAAIILATIPFWIAMIGFVSPAGESARLRTLALLFPGLAGVIIAVVLGWAVLSEPLDAAMLFGRALVVASIAGLLVFDPRPIKKDVAHETVR